MRRSTSESLSPSRPTGRLEKRGRAERRDLRGMADILVGLMGLTRGRSSPGPVTRSSAGSARAAWASCTRWSTSGWKKRYVTKIVTRRRSAATRRRPSVWSRRARVLAGSITERGAGSRLRHHPRRHELFRDGSSKTTCDHAMKAARFSSARAVSICADVLDALDHVHRRGIVHRDIKPENVFLAEMPEQDRHQVLDFGIVHIFDAERVAGPHHQDRRVRRHALLRRARADAEQPAGLRTTSTRAPSCSEMLQGRRPFDTTPASASRAASSPPASASERSDPLGALEGGRREPRSGSRSVPPPASLRHAAPGAHARAHRSGPCAATSIGCSAAHRREHRAEPRHRSRSPRRPRLPSGRRAAIASTAPVSTRLRRRPERAFGARVRRADARLSRRGHAAERRHLARRRLHHRSGAARRALAIAGALATPRSPSSPSSRPPA